MELTVEQEERKLKNDLRKVMATLDKCVTEKDLRKAYRDKIGHNVNIVIDKINAGNFVHFMRFKCRHFCEVDKLEGVTRVHRLFEAPAESEEPKNHKKKRKTKAAPKLNFPRIGIINSSTFPRPNPQGFNKGKTIKDGKALTSLPYYQPKYPLAYRPEAQLSKLKNDQKDDNKESEKVSYDEQCYIFDRSYAEAIATQAANEAAAQALKAQPPSVKNSFDFPTLPEKQRAAEEYSDHESNGQGDVYESHEEYSSDEEDAADDDEENEDEEEEEEGERQVKTSLEAAELVLEQMKNIKLHESCQPSKVFYQKIDLDDPIFRFEFPPVVTDPLFTIPNPKFKVLGQKILFEVSLTTIYSPSQFWFQYGDASLCFFMNRLKAFYSSLSDGDLYMSGSTMQPGLVVAAEVMNSWHRAQVVSGPGSDGQVILFFLDFGTRNSIHMSQIRYLLKTFTEEPVKALRGSMIDACPAHGGGQWSCNARKTFFELVANKKLFASIRYFGEGVNVYELELTDQINSSMRIGQLLVRLGHAVPDQSNDSFFYAIPLPVAAANKLF